MTFICFQILEYVVRQQSNETNFLLAVLAILQSANTDTLLLPQSSHAVETIRFILTEEFGMRKICAQMVPRNLTEQQRDAWLSAVFDIQVN